MGFFVELVIFFFRVYIGIICVRMITSWFRISPVGFWIRAYKFLVDITEPFLIIFRKIIPLAKIGRFYIDLSYIVVIIIIELLILLLRYISYRYM
ncbi:MAG: YggT family protein [Actinobacteria bacterium]|nr:YggT family protein [Actinomycetota bacterium]